MVLEFIAATVVVAVVVVAIAGNSSPVADGVPVGLPLAAMESLAVP